jgi:flagellar biosynthesis/type III secretory pathway protein FliH
MEEKIMSIKSYIEVLKWAIKSQLEHVEEESNGTFATEYMEGYYEGVKKGLEIALEKIDASMFLAKE